MIRAFALVFLIALAAAVWSPSASAQVAWVSTSNQDGAGQTTSDPGDPAGCVEDDLVICTVSIGTQDGNFTTVPADMIALDAEMLSTSGNSTELGAWYKIRGATAGSGYNFGYSGSAATMRAACSCFHDPNGPPSFHVAFSEASHFNEAQDTPNLAAPAIAAVNNGMVYIYQIMTDNDLTAIVQPSGYDLRLSETGTAGRQVSASTKAITVTGTETPGAPSHTSSTGNEDSRNMIFSIAPAAVAGTAATQRRSMMQ